ncbi:MAG: DegV family protein [Firmicutes bacterium]|nr:DegV family protein [Bacillota bacterium]
MSLHHFFLALRRQGFAAPGSNHAGTTSREATALQVAIVTDATASLPPAWIRDWKVTVLPVPVQFGQETFLDGVDPVEAFYRRIEAGERPTTSTPAPGAFLERYKALAAAGARAIISIHVMASKSAVFQSARMAGEMLPEVPVYPVDSGSVTMGLGLLVRAAARWARAGLSAREIAQRLHAAAERVRVLVAIPDLTFLRRSGRVSLGQALVAGLLSVKPLLEVHRGAIEVVDRVRAWPRALDRLVERVQERLARGVGELAVVHTATPAVAEDLARRLAGLFPALAEGILVTEAGAGLASHVGPGAVAVCLLEPPAAG